MHAIETTYKNIKFRSRLEAKWACFFDLVGWKWEYEPIDFNGWIPDFAIYGKDIVYVEVKPVIEFPKDIADEIDRSGCDKETLIIGQANPIDIIADNYEIFGWFNDVDLKTWGYAIYGEWFENYRSGYDTSYFPGLEPASNTPMGFCSYSGSYIDRISGIYIGRIPYWHTDKIQKLWAESCNITQWKKT
jgi:hypothetical protein